VRPGEDVEVDALPPVFAIPALPNVRNWCTIEDTGECECQSVRNRYCRKCVTRDPKLFAGKYSKAEAQEGDLGERYRHEVEYLREPGELHLLSLD
jgi:hypothetical protein